MALRFVNPFRLREESGHSIRIPALIAAGTAAFVLLAPTAGAGVNGSTRQAGAVGHVTGHRVVKHKTPTGHKTSKPGKKVTTVGKLKPVPAASTPVPYIYVPVPMTSAPPYVDSNACVDTGTDCTDEQLCDIWGMNCASVPPFVEPAPASTTAASTSADPAGA